MSSRRGRVPEEGQALTMVVCDMGPLHYLILIDLNLSGRSSCSMRLRSEGPSQTSPKSSILEHRTPFYVGDKVRVAIERMKQRDLQRKQAQE